MARTRAAARGSRRRSSTVLAGAAATALGLALGVAAPAPTAAAQTTRTTDPQGDTQQPVNDVLATSLRLDGSRVTATVYLLAWDGALGSVDVVAGLDTTGDGTPDYRVLKQRGSGTGPASLVRVPASGPVVPVACTVTTASSVQASAFSLSLPASCLGNPSSARLSVVLTRDVGGTTSRDAAPDTGVGAATAAGPSAPDGPLAVVSRFWSPRFGNAHFFTIDTDEAQRVRGMDANWVDEGYAFATYPAQAGACPAGAAPVFRFWSPRFTSHFFTVSVPERDRLVATDRNWTYEGVAYCAPTSQVPGSVPLYRFWSPRFGKHFFTADAAEAHQLDVNDPAWEAEGIAYYVLPASAAGRVLALGPGAPLGFRPFPASDPWNTRIASAPVDPASATLIASIGTSRTLHADFGANWNGGPFGIPYVVVGPGQPRVAVTFGYADESDPGPYPVPLTAPIEGGASSGGDRHVLVVDAVTRTLYELYDAHPHADGSWTAGSGAVFDLVDGTTRPAGWTSADAAGLPILPGLVRYEEVAAGHIDHAIRFTVAQTRKAYVAPARHFASSSTSASLPPMGMRVRLKAGFDISGYPQQARVILQAMKDYGMIVADNGSSWYVSGAPDPRWDDEQLNTLKNVPGSAFEVVQMGPVTTG